MIKNILKLKNLTISIKNKVLIKNFNLEINENEIHVLMGPNGSGKSTLVKILSGHPLYNLVNGKIQFYNENLLNIPPEIRSHKGLFLAFQYPLEIHGLTNYDFLYLIYNEKRKYFCKPEINPFKFIILIEKLLKRLKINNEFLNRNLNEGFSGGEKKLNEILQLLLLKPKLILLDEIDSGLDLDIIKRLFNELIQNKDKCSSMLIITHSPNILQYFVPTFIHIITKDKSIKTGDLKYITKLKKEGYSSF